MATVKEIKKISKSDDQILVPTPTKITLINGDIYEIPPITWGREIRILRVIKSILEGVFGAGVNPTDIPRITNDMTEDEKAAALIKLEELNAQVNKNLMQALLDNGPEQITEAASALLDQDAEWVEEHLTIDSILEVLVPFLLNKQEAITRVMKPFVGGKTK